MNRHSIYGFLFLLFIAGNISAEESLPNIVLLISDDQTWTDYGFMGHDVIKTPNLDKLARESALFTRGYVPTSLCRPSLATLISGLYPHQHLITGNDPPRGTNRQRMLAHIKRIPKLPQLLKKKGYVSFQSGKWWEGSHQEGGFTQGMTHGIQSKGGRHGDKGLKIGRTGMKPVLDFIDQNQEKPFLIWYAPFLPHTPHTPPERLLKKYLKEGRPKKLSRYYAMCDWFDETCGQILNHLENKKLTDNTLIVYVTDNGWIQRTPKTKVPENWRFHFAPKSKRSPYDGGIRTPIMLKWPDKIRPEKRKDLVNSIDLVPTILAAAGIKPDSQMQGINLLNILNGTAENKRESIFGEIFEHDEIDIHKASPGLLHRWCIHGNWKLIVPKSGKLEDSELYFLKEDPFEKKNLVSVKREIAEKLHQEINQWWDGKD
jgi:arylsulfatase A-like enzyme